MVCSSLLAIALMLWLPGAFASIPIDNSVELEPQIVCGSTAISVTFLLRNNFEGHVYVKNRYNESQCRNDQTGKRTASITVPFSTCGVQRTRSLNPRGVYVSTVIIISFHPRFITTVDRAYSFQCFYMESEKTVGASMDIPEITSVLQTQRVPMPVCRYEILDAQPPNGQPIRHSIVGQPVFHRWICDTETANVFCMSINSCFVHDGLGEQAQLLDASGCAIDRYLMQNLEYTSDLSAVREAHVFKFADRNAIYFQCQITITVREPNYPCPRPTCATLATRPGYGEYGGTAGELRYSTPPYPLPYQRTPEIITAYPFTSPPPYVFRTTSNASFRAFTIADAPVTVTEHFETAQNQSTTVGPRRRRHRSTNFSTPDSNDSSIFSQELGIWDVRAPSIAVFDLDDNSMAWTKINKSIFDHSEAFGVYDDKNPLDYCIHQRVFGLLLAMAITPTLALATVSFIYYLKQRSKRFIL